MRLISWNVNGLRAAIKNGFEQQLYNLDADVVALQEVKMLREQLEIDFKGYSLFMNSAEKRGYSGTAVLTRLTPSAVYNDFDAWRELDKTASIPEGFESEGRIITLEFESFYFVNVYTPNSRRELERLPYRMEWEDAFRRYVSALDSTKPVIMCGDFNVAHNEIDIKRPSANRHSAGFTDEERAKMTKLLSAGFADTFRRKYPEATDAYTWWSYMGNARARNIGWRIDYFLVSERLFSTVEDAVIHPEIMGSDHCPVGLILK